eukprot:scaffold62889_cov48-Phaeocystis_antarctica.AAC.1
MLHHFAFSGDHTSLVAQSKSGSPFLPASITVADGDGSPGQLQPEQSQPRLVRKEQVNKLPYLVQASSQVPCVPFVLQTFAGGGAGGAAGGGDGSPGQLQPEQSQLTL